MDRYALISTKMPREFVLLQGMGCRWRKCTFCDYHEDVSERPFEVNEPVLRQVTGQYGVLDVINSGSAMELDEETISLIKEVVKEKKSIPFGSRRTTCIARNWLPLPNNLHLSK